MAVASPSERSLEETPTWAVALVCAVFIIISVIIEHGIHSLGKVIINITFLYIYIHQLL
ncbi:hypothetical protein HanPI659440_Chr06g0252291 [Helianthus annuus]|nr:hypothetical protein HanHA300_Chr06g0228341 [Helianthus annuus]KAJ0574975.1 hypothetical protein HanHA89_Chr06g0244301 [Helianthus annuus]KAJ0739305.1 hypothetical protein HanLR1_Chr06g0228351 [Helianthus annuus]KAJ0781704.1 hypothetical protein HanPI659440_Chr06g0252291 [Helianthus annuus]